MRRSRSSSSLTLDVKPCEVKPKNLGENFASGLLLSETQTSSLPQFRSYFSYWRKNGGARLAGCQSCSMKDLLG
jgi:hypothetical protein